MVPSSSARNSLRSYSEKESVLNRRAKLLGGKREGPFHLSRMRSPHSPFSAERTSEGNLSSSSPLTTNGVEEIRLLLVDLEGGVSGLSRHGRRGLSGSIGLAISDTKIAGVLNHTKFLLCIPGGAGLHRADFSALPCFCGGEKKSAQIYQPGDSHCGASI